MQQGWSNVRVLKLLRPKYLGGLIHLGIDLAALSLALLCLGLADLFPAMGGPFERTNNITHPDQWECFSCLVMSTLGLIIWIVWVLMWYCFSTAATGSTFERWHWDISDHRVAYRLTEIIFWFVRWIVLVGLVSMREPMWTAVAYSLELALGAIGIVALLLYFLAILPLIWFCKQIGGCITNIRKDWQERSE